MVQPGDIILIKTPSMVYSGLRNLFRYECDHALVVVDQERCLHISYPRAKLVPTWSYLQISKEPIIIRPTAKAMDEQTRQKFISDVKHEFVGKAYDSMRLVRHVRRSFADRARNHASEFGQTFVQNASRLKSGLWITKNHAYDS